jgi:hypothetical protein
MPQSFRGFSISKYFRQPALVREYKTATDSSLHAQSSDAQSSDSNYYLALAAGRLVFFAFGAAGGRAAISACSSASLASRKALRRAVLLSHLCVSSLMIAEAAAVVARLFCSEGLKTRFGWTPTSGICFGLCFIASRIIGYTTIARETFQVYRAVV